MSSLESSIASDIWRNTSRTEAQGLHLKHGLFIRENRKQPFSQKNCLVALAVCAPAESSLSPGPLQLGWHRVSADTAAPMPMLTAPTATLSWKLQALLSWLCPRHSDTKVSGSPSDTSVTSAFLPFLRMTQRTWAFHLCYSTALFLASWPVPCCAAEFC